MDLVIFPPYYALNLLLLVLFYFVVLYARSVINGYGTITVFPETAKIPTAKNIKFITTAINARTAVKINIISSPVSCMASTKT